MSNGLVFSQQHIEAAFWLEQALDSALLAEVAAKRSMDWCVCESRSGLESEPQLMYAAKWQCEREANERWACYVIDVRHALLTDEVPA